MLNTCQSIPNFATLYVEHIGKHTLFIEGEEITSTSEVNSGDIIIKRGDKLIKTARLPNGLIQFKPETGEDRVVLDCVTALQNGADLLWIETEKPHVGQIASMVDRVKAVIPNAKLVYNLSLIHISEPTRQAEISYAVFCLKKKKACII